jgi:LuxR family maltose regulon positive regulatory protein
MTFSIHESIEPNGAFDMTFNSHTGAAAPQEDYPIVREKLRIPRTDFLIARPRITNLLKRSQSQFPATLISGRSGTGKTAIAASFATGTTHVAWFTVESTDMDWSVFSRYFSASLQTSGICRSDPVMEAEERSPTPNEVAGYLANLFCLADPLDREERSLIVLDDIHHIFDADWFGNFFNLLLYSLPADTHLLLLCRSRPPSPLWRLRSKQMLNVLDEKVIAFNVSETEDLYKDLGLPTSDAERAQRDSFGRVATLVRSA